MAKVKCTGIIFKGIQSQYFNKNTMSFNYRESFKLLKRKSCVCNLCQTTIKEFSRGLGQDMLDCVYWFKTFNHEPIENGALYRLVLKKWESGWDEISGESKSWPTEFKMKIIKA